jgi:DNA-binding transcriptional MerR regulator
MCVMKIAELSRRAAVPIPTIKFYIREGMLPRGERTARNQAVYAEAHLERLALIATLQQVGLSLAVIKQALQAMDATPGDDPRFMAIAVGALEPPRDGVVDAATTAQAEALLRAVVQRRGWDVDPDSPVWEAAVRACAGILNMWPGALSEPGLERYAAVSETVAAFELPEEWNPTVSPAEALKYVVLGTVLFEPLILALRRLAHVDRGNKLRARRTGAVSAIARGDPQPR